jgi:DNA-binding NtrC family response regulator
MQQTDMLSKKVIMVVEDDQSIGELIEAILAEEASYRTIIVPHSDEVMAIALQENPDLFVLDYRLENENGLQLYDQLHALEQFQSVPAIIVSASIEKYIDELNERKLVSLAKPFDVDEFMTVVRQNMR